MQKWLFTLAAFVMTQPAFSLEFEQTKLDNGIQVLVVPDERAPVVVNFVWYNIGAADEDDDNTGLAHMLEHLMFKGTEKIPPQEFSKIIARNGGKDNAFTSYDYTAYYQKIAKDKLPLAMEMEADRMTGLTFTEKDFLTERDVIAEERRWRVDSKPTARFYEELQGKHFDAHPYRRPVIGYMEHIQTYTREDNLKWYKDYYNPSNATLILVGDVRLDDILPEIKRTYGQVPRKEVHRAPWAVEPEWNEAKRFKKVDPDVKVPVFERFYRAPSYFEGVAGVDADMYEALTLALASDLLGGGSTSLLYRRLVQEKKIADSASTAYHALSRGETTFDITVQPKPGVLLSEIEKATEEVIAEFLSREVEESKLENAKTTFLSSAIYAQDDLFYKGYQLGRWVVAGGKPENFDDWQEDIKTITPEDVLRVARKYLVEGKSTTGLLVAHEEQF